MKKEDIKIGVNVEFISGNFAGLTGIIQNVDWNSTNKKAIFGYYHEVLLSDGRVGFIEKSEHFRIIKHKGKVLTKQEVEENRSSAYEYLRFS